MDGPRDGATVTRVLHLSSGGNGGAARAARSLHAALVAHGVDSTLWEADGGLRFRIASELDRRLWQFQRSPVKTWRSPALFGSLSARKVNDFSADVVNLHWVTNGFLSVAEIGRITSPVAWSMVDLWPVAGTEHYPASGPDARFRRGYTRGNRPVDESGIDLDRWTWNRKRRDWTPMHLVPASGWLEECVRSSALARSWPVARIPHVVDTSVFAPMDRLEARRLLELPESGSLVGFLSSAGTLDRRKGWDLLEQALTVSPGSGCKTTAVIAGPLTSAPAVPFVHVGELRGEDRLRAMYAACDVIAVPSREDTMPLVAMEAQSCGTPVLGFRIGGLPDIVLDGVTGALVEPFSVQQFASALARIIDEPPHLDMIRSHATATWSPTVIATRYAALYDRVSPPPH